MSTKRKVETNIWDKYQLEEGWFTFLASVLALLTVVWSIEGAKWVAGLYLLPQAALVGFFIGFGLSKVRFVPALLAHSFMVSVGMVFVGLLVAPFANAPFDDWSRKLGSTVLRVVRWCENAIAGNAREDGLVYLVMLTFGMWVLGYLTSWLLFRGHRVWWILAILGSVLMVNLSFNPPNQFASFTFFIIVSLLLVVRFSAYMDEQRWRSLRLYFQPGLWRGAMAVGGCLVLVITAVAFATPSSSQIDPIGQVLNQVSQPFNNVRGIWDNVGTGSRDTNLIPPRSQSNYNSLDDSFTIGGPLRLSNDPFFRVTSENGAPPLYMQAKTMDEYDGKGWTNTYQSAVGQINNEALFRRLSLAANQALPTPANKGSGANKLTLTSLVPNFNPVITLGDLISADKQTLVAFHYEKTVLNVPISSFVLKELPDGNGGKRTVLVEEKSGKVVPPAALDLIKYLKEATELEELTVPTLVNFTYSKQSNGWNISYQQGTRGPVNYLNRSQNYALSLGRFDYKLPNPEELEALKLQPGGSRAINRLVGAVVSNKSLPDKPLELSTSVYLSNNGNYVVTIESPFAQEIRARERFESTEVGKKVTAEIRKLQEAVKGNKISYELREGKPYLLRYEGYEPNYDDLTGGVLQTPLAPGDSLTTVARRYRADQQSLRRVGTEYPDWLKSRYLQLPKTFSPGIKDLAEELTVGLTNPYDKALAIQNYLSSLTYSTDPGVVPEGRDDIDYFLFDTRTGYCTHFSSSMALMLRSLGIPTRIATGFISGEYEASDASYLVRGNAAHAWPQVYFAGTGWVDFEPTPGREGIQRPIDPSAVPPVPSVTPAPAPTAGPNLPSVPEVADPIEKPKSPITAPEVSPTPTSQTPRDLPFWLLGVVGLGLAGLGIYQGRRWYFKRLYAVPDPSPLVVYNRMSSAARQAGLRGRSGMTPNEYATYLSRQLPIAAGSVEAITRSYVRRRYGPTGPDLADEQRKQHLEVLRQAEEKLLQAQAAGHDAQAEDLWDVFKANSHLHQDNRNISEVWQSYQEAVLRYRRQKRLERLTPRFVSTLRARLKIRKA